MRFLLLLRKGWFTSTTGSFKKGDTGVPIVVQWKQIRLGTMRFRVRSLASLSGLRIRRCRELWYRSQTRLGAGIAVVVV